ncbi:MAG: hypothetical protein J7K23_08465 [Thermoproteales archaeon]|nr:hypothetical protein [Thermoproteales archaeon]
MRWRDLSKDAKIYILYHTFSCPLLFTWYLVPYYLFKNSYSPLDIGIIFTFAKISSIPLTYLIGKYFAYHDLKKGLIAIDLLGALSFIFYFLAKGELITIMIILATFVDEIAKIFYPIYSAYERAIYPTRKLKEIMEWHLRLPELSIIISYLSMGFYYAYICPKDECILNTFLLFAFIELFFAYFILNRFKTIILKEQCHKKIKSFSLKLSFPIAVWIYTIYVNSWVLLPSFAWVNFIMKEYGGNIFYIAVVESVISFSSIIATYISNFFKEEQGYIVMIFSVIIIAVSLTFVVMRPFFFQLIALAFFIRLGDALWFIYNRTWMYKSIDKEDISEVMASISAINRGFGVIAPYITGFLAVINTILPFMLGLLMMIIVILLTFYDFLKRQKIRD